MKSIAKIRLVKKHDEIGCFDGLGKYTDDLYEGVIVRQYGDFWENLTEEQKENIRTRSSEYRGFLPSAGDEKVGSECYQQYGMQDYKRVLKYERNEWEYEQFYIEAEITVNDTIQYIRSGGLSGIESDINGSDMNSDISDECNSLRRILEELGFKKLELDNAFQQANLKW